LSYLYDSKRRGDLLLADDIVGVGNLVAIGYMVGTGNLDFTGDLLTTDAFNFRDD